MPYPSPPVYGGIEAGGTKFVCAVGTGPDDVLALEHFPTTTPDETFAGVVRFFESSPSPIAALGIGSFGPTDPNPSSPTFGYITTTPKPGWAQTDFAGAMRNALRVPVAFDTDVNVAGLGEQVWGAAQGLDTFLYVTVGTGIGGGGLIGGMPMRGLIHPEMGHLQIPRAKGDDFAGVCPYHGACLEGMANGPALEARWGTRAENLPPDHPAWEIEAHYLAYAVANYIYVLSPQRIVLGGGVMKQRQLFPLIRRRVQDILNGYVQAPTILDHIDGYIVPPALGDRAGVLGALALAQRAVRTEPS
jgi:fructokinase